jgi:hypothetical protein
LAWIIARRVSGVQAFVCPKASAMVELQSGENAVGIKRRRG